MKTELLAKRPRLTRVCPVCGKEFRISEPTSKAKFCSNRCYGQTIKRSDISDEQIWRVYLDNGSINAPVRLLGCNRQRAKSVIQRRLAAIARGLTNYLQ